MRGKAVDLDAFLAELEALHARGARLFKFVDRTFNLNIKSSLKIMQFFLGHPDTLDFGRKFKIALSGCRHEACALVSIHDLGLIAVNDGGERKFDIFVGGGLGAVPFQAKLLAERVPMKEVLPVSQAIARIFARMGEKKNRQKARLKFVIQKVGIEEFKRLVAEERKAVPHDPRHDAFGQGIESTRSCV